jgi:DNA-binding response OmpR family regulator
MRVLLVDDDPNFAQSVVLMLEDVGHRCVATTSGEEAIELAKTRDFDFILLDLLLPDIDGYEVIEQLKLEGIPTPYLIQSGLVDRDSEFGGLAFGTGEYLVKPFTKSELVSGMEAVIARSRLMATADPEYAPRLQIEPEPEGPKHRQHRRFKTLKNARIDYGDGIDCRILNLSHNGAAIRLPDEKAEFPPTFFLDLQSGEHYHCRVCWRHKDKIGVKFLGLDL